MQTVVAAALSLALGASVTLAQSTSAPTTGAITKEDAKAAAARKTAEAIAECMKLWDAKTHMTKAQWARTCQRIQTRLESLKVDSTMGLPPKQVERKKGKGG
jgi:hypothetical protein